MQIPIRHLLLADIVAATTATTTADGLQTKPTGIPDQHREPPKLARSQPLLDSAMARLRHNQPVLVAVDKPGLDNPLVSTQLKELLEKDTII